MQVLADQIGDRKTNSRKGKKRISYFILLFGSDVLVQYLSFYDVSTLWFV